MLHNDRVQEIVNRLGDPYTELSAEDRDLMSWLLYKSWSLVEWKALHLRGEPDLLGTGPQWQEALFEFYRSVERGEGPPKYSEPED